MTRIRPIVLLSFKEGIRNKVLYSLILFALLLVIFSVLISGLFMRDITKIILDICLTAVDISGLLVPFFLAVTLLSGDIENRTIYTILARPIPRSSYIIGKFFGLALITLTLMGIVTLATMLAVWIATFVYSANFFTTLSIPAILTCVVYSFAGILMLNSIVLLWSSLTTSSFLTFILTVATYLVGQSIEDLVRFISIPIQGVHISLLIQKITTIALYLFPNLASFDLKPMAVYGKTPGASELFMLLAGSVAYCTIALLLSIFFFQRRDLT